MTGDGLDAGGRPSGRRLLRWWRSRRALNPGRPDAPAPVDRHIAFHRVLDALRGDGCPACALVARGVSARLGETLREQLNDPTSRLRLRRSLGFCERHARTALSLAGALEMAILCHDLVAHALRRLDAWRSGQRPAALDACPECAAERRDLAEVVALIADLLADETVRSAYRTSAGLCVPHLEEVLRRSPEAGRAWLLEEERRRLRALEVELAERIRKADWRYCREPIGPEGDAHVRAAIKLSGIAPESGRA